MKLFVDIDESEFVKECVVALNNEKTTVIEDVFKVIKNLSLKSLNKKSELLKVKFKYYPDFYDNHLSLKDYITKGYQEEKYGICLWYFGLELYFKKDADIKIDDISFPDFFVSPVLFRSNVKMVDGGVGITINLKSIFERKDEIAPEKKKQELIKPEFIVKHINQKKADKFCVRATEFVLKKEVCEKMLLEVSNNKYKQVLLPSKNSVWNWMQTFYDKISGESFFCSCFKKALDLYEKTDNDFEKQLHKTTSPHLKFAIKNQSFKDNICHVCTGKNSDLLFCHKMYGSVFKTKYGAYIRKISIEKNIDERDAENMLRELKGVAKIGEKWINETLLFNYVKIIFPKYEVVREASPEWLGRQRLDILIPEINLAIEYQGKQHYESIEFFGGEESFEKAIMRDELKLKKCKKNNVTLVYFNYKEDLTEKLVEKRLEAFL